MALLTMLSSRFRNSSSPSVRLQLRRMASGHCLLFPGQGSQFQGMAKSLIEEAEEGTLPSVAQLFSVAQRVLGYDLRDLFLNGPSSVLDEDSALPTSCCGGFTGCPGVPQAHTTSGGCGKVVIPPTSNYN